MRRLRPATIAALLIAIGAIRMATTWRVYSATNDEAAHIGSGLELFQYHRYWLLRENPPLPRVVLSAWPWFSGMRYDPHGTFTDQIHSVFYGHGEYKPNLVRARAGTVVFFIIAAIALFFTARDALGDGGSLVALFLFTMEPIVLGYSALATHDGAAVAGLAVALLAFGRFLRHPDLKHALVFGAAFGFSVDCKFSSIVFVPVTCVAIAAVRLIRDAELRKHLARAIASLVPAAVVTLFVIWAGYGFTVGTFGELAPWSDAFRPSMQRLLARIGPRAPLPASDFFAGIAALMKIDKEGFQTFLCGRSGTTGWWWYFPFAAAIKTTIAGLILFLSGAWFALRDHTLRGSFAEWSLAALGMVIASMPTALDLGIRYILPFYIPFAIAAAATVLAMLRASRATAVIAVALLVFHLGASALAHPDYFPYFNAFAGREPSRYLIDSNVDWGQDILRLRGVVRREHAGSLAISLMGPADYVALGFPPVYPASAWTRSNGWVAVSDHSYQMAKTQGGWKWLPDTYQRVGKSIRLYYIP
ncbi:MAG TPA: glycosyltransferase family 39 protein [Thermoanaerobaculia bacterium]|nr:glycosyltransferase family 39 protein [Thermoanaerobaculia bacterium]